MALQKAYRLHSYGGPEAITLDDVPIPRPGPLQVLVAISAVGMNPFDWKIREGHVREVLPLPLPAILGVDFVGTIVAVGDKVSRLKVGDRVMTMSQSLGAFAEYITVDEEILSRVPSGLSDISAASLPIPATTAWQALRTAGPPTPGMRILIHGASGINGAFAVQFAKAAGAIVIATASGKNRDYVISLGADEFIDYETQRFEDHVKDVDLILDFVLVGGVDNTTTRSWGLLKPNAAIVSVADPTIASSVPPGFRGYFPRVNPDAIQLEKIAEQVSAGQVVSKIGKVFPRNELIEAMELNKRGGTTGRLVVDFKKV